MTITLDGVFPWGRSCEEYVGMFALSAEELGGRILGRGDGPASFQAEARRLGHSVVSCDPLYHFGRNEIAGRVRATHQWLVRTMRADAEPFVWDRYSCPEAVGAARLRSMRIFLADWPKGPRKRSVSDRRTARLELPDDLRPGALLPFPLPLLRKPRHRLSRGGGAWRCVGWRRRCGSSPSSTWRAGPRLTFGPLVEAMMSDGLAAEIVTVPYEFQLGAHQMLRILRTDGSWTAPIPASPPRRAS